MREIKFRAWDKKNARMIGTGFGSVGFRDGDAGRMFYRPTAMIDDQSNLCSSEWLIMQYTGLKDKNGVEIYEGDVLAYRDGEWSYDAVVEWDDESGRYYMRGIEPVDNFSFDDIDPDEHKVIGNIYENPELVEAKNEL